MISYEDLEVAGADCAQKEADKNKRGRKREGKVQATCVQGTAEGAAQAETQESASVLPQVAGAHVGNHVSVRPSCPGRAPVAQMW